MLLSTIINEFKDSFFRTYNNNLLMPGASIDPQTGRWKEKSGKYLFSHKALAKVFRAKLLHLLQLVLQVAPYRTLVRKLKPRLSIICRVCGAAMVITATMIARPPAMAVPVRQ